MTQQRAERKPSPIEAFVARFHRPFISVIADYGPSGDLAFSEVTTALQGTRRNHRHAELGITNVPAFSTLATGLQIEQLGLRAKNRPANYHVFSNTAPRGSDAHNGDQVIWKGNEKQKFVLAELDNGIKVFAVNAGYNLSFVKNHIVRLREINVTNNGTQFRSRDQYAPATRQIIAGGPRANQLLGEDLDVATAIPDKPQLKISYIDGYGNVKTSLKLSELKHIAANQNIDLQHDESINITIDGVTKTVKNSFAEGVSPVHGELFITTGSSGDPEDPYIEFISMRGREAEENTAAQQFEVRGQRDDLGNIEISKTPVVAQV